MKQIIFVVLLVICLAILSGCSDKTYTELEKSKELLTYISERLEMINDDCSWASKKGDYDLMKEELEMTCLRCKDLKKEIDEALLFGF